MEICPFSGLPFTCALCPEDDAPCYEKTKLRTKDFKKLKFSLVVSVYFLGHGFLEMPKEFYNYLLSPKEYINA